MDCGSGGGGSAGGPRKQEGGSWAGKEEEGEMVGKGHKATGRG